MEGIRRACKRISDGLLNGEEGGSGGVAHVECDGIKLASEDEIGRGGSSDARDDALSAGINGRDHMVSATLHRLAERSFPLLGSTGVRLRLLAGSLDGVRDLSCLKERLGGIRLHTGEHFTCRSERLLECLCRLGDSPHSSHSLLSGRLDAPSPGREPYDTQCEIQQEGSDAQLDHQRLVRGPGHGILRGNWQRGADRLPERLRKGGGEAPEEGEPEHSERRDESSQERAAPL